MIPAWLQRSRGDATRVARIRLCPRCHAPIIVGLDADMCALTAHADPTPINETGEALAQLTERRTYDYTKTLGAPRLEYRAEWNITAPRRYPVLAEHRCGQTLPADKQEATPRKKTSDVPEF